MNKRVLKKILMILIASFSMLFACVFVKQRKSSLPTPHVGLMEANHPWMIFNPTMEQDLVFPFADKQNSNVVYLVFVMKHGESVKINLINKEITPYRFNVNEFEDVVNFANKYNSGQTYENPLASLWTEFRGTREERVVEHMYGYPIPNKPGKRKVEFRTGYYYIMDKINNIKRELLRVNISNSDLDFGGLGTTYISPNKKWVVFTLANHPSRTFIFNREEKVPEVFSTDHEAQCIEVWKNWGPTMGAHP